MNIISRFVLILGTILIGAFLVFSTFVGGKSNFVEDFSFQEVELGTFELQKDEEDRFSIVEKNLNNDNNEEKIFVEQVSNISRFFTNNEISEVIVGRKGEESKINIEPHIYLNIKPGIYLFDLNEVNKNFIVDGGLFAVENKGAGSFMINNINPSKTVVFALDTIINLSVKSEDETLTSILLYPHSYIIFNQKRNFLVKNGDLLKVSSIFTLDFLSEKIFTQNKEQTINSDFVDIITLKDNTHKPFVENVLHFLASELKEKENIFQKYKSKSFLTLPGEIYIQKYFSLFLNTEKQKIYYKNIILRNIITLFHQEEEDPRRIKVIEENIKKLEQIDLKEAKNMKKIIYFYYLNNLKIKESSIIAAMNFSNLIHTIEHDNENIEKSDALFFLKNIFKNYDFRATSNILERISLFKEKYLGTKLEYDKTLPQYKEIEYLLFFLEKLLTAELKESDKYIEQISILLEDFTNISTTFYDDNNESIRKTGLFKNLIVLEKVSQIILHTYFQPERNPEGLLERGDNKVNRDNITRLEKSINKLTQFYNDNKQFLDNSQSHNTITIEAYIEHINIFQEFFDALNDYEKYKSKYDTEKNIFLGGESILGKEEENTNLNISKAYNYIKNFNGTSLQKIKIDIKDYEYCINPSEQTENKNTDPYCYEIKNLDINGNMLGFILIPDAENKISEITINNIPKSGTYKLDIIKEDLGEKIETISKIEEREKYDFKNFFLNTFSTQTISEEKEIYENKENTLAENKIIKTFKRNKLLGETGDFSILKGFLDIKYNDLIVEKDYSISIKQSYFNLTINTCTNKECEKNLKEYEGILESEYEFTNSHKFKNIKVRIKDNEEIHTDRYKLGGNEIEIIGDIGVESLKGEITILLSHIDNLEKSIDYLKNNLEIENIKIKYYTYSKRAKIESSYRNKKLDIYIETGGKVNIYYDGKRIHEQTLGMPELENILNQIK